MLFWFSTAKQPCAVSDKHLTSIKDKQGKKKRVKTKGEVLWVTKGLPKKAKQLWWHAGKSKSSWAHQPGWIISTDWGLFLQLENWLQNDPPGLGHGIQVSRPTQDGVQASRPLGYMAAFPLRPTHLFPSSSPYVKQAVGRHIVSKFIFNSFME